MYAELVINVEAPLAGTFHYYVPSDLETLLGIGQLVEVEFGRRLAQGIVIGFSDVSPVEETKPIVAVVEDEPVVLPWQIDLAFWLSEHYLASVNACLQAHASSWPDALGRYYGRRKSVLGQSGASYRQAGGVDCFA